MDNNEKMVQNERKDKGERKNWTCLVHKYFRGQEMEQIMADTIDFGPGFRFEGNDDKDRLEIEGEKRGFSGEKRESGESKESLFLCVQFWD